MNDLQEDVVDEFLPHMPVPVDDGACRHLTGLPLPFMALPSTAGGQINFACQRGRAIIYCYPMMGWPKDALTESRARISGTAGSIAQCCAFRDGYIQLKDLGVSVYGLSVQTTEDQKEVVQQLNLPYELLSDRNLSFVQALNLPTFEVSGIRLIKRLTLIVRNGTIEKCFYPVFPPEQNASEIIAWIGSGIGRLGSHASQSLLP